MRDREPPSTGGEPKREDAAGEPLRAAPSAPIVESTSPEASLAASLADWSVGVPSQPVRPAAPFETIEGVDAADILESGTEVASELGPEVVDEASELEATMAEVLALEPAMALTPRLDSVSAARLARATVVEGPAHPRAARRAAPPPPPPSASPRPHSAPPRVRAEPPILGEAGRYTILGSLHRGGMGEILLARLTGREGFSKKVVLKGLLSRLAEDDVSYQLFMREARVMAALEHPNVVRVFDLPYIGDQPFLAMEYVRGRNFHQFIHRAGLLPDGMPLSIALHVVAEVLRGLHSAHHAKGSDGQPLGVVHRDVSPGNILVSYLGEVKVTDFGIAQIAHAPRFTGPRSVRGKARYVAPEQIHGHSASVASDVYSAGVVLAEALIGRPLWERGAIPETLLAIISEDREAVIRDVLTDRPNMPELEAVLRSALALEPRDRFESALAFAEALESIARASGERATHVELGRFARRLFRDAPDLPSDDGFAGSRPPSPLPAPRVEGTDPADDDGEENTNPTVISLEPGWAKGHSAQGAHATEVVRPRDPLATARALPRRTSVPISRALPRPRSSLRPIDPPPVKIRAVALPVHAAVIEDREGARPFAEGLTVESTDEESSRAIDPRRAVASARNASTRIERPPQETRLFLAGLFIGATLAVAGILVALLFRT